MSINPKNLTVALLTVFLPIAAHANPDNDADGSKVSEFSNNLVCDNPVDSNGLNLCLYSMAVSYMQFIRQSSWNIGFSSGDEQSYVRKQGLCVDIPESLDRAMASSHQFSLGEISSSQFRWDFSGATLNISECLAGRANFRDHDDKLAPGAQLYRDAAEKLADISRIIQPQ